MEPLIVPAKTYRKRDSHVIEKDRVEPIFPIYELQG